MRCCCAMIWRCPACGTRWADATECALCQVDTVWAEPPPGPPGTPEYQAWLERVAAKQRAVFQTKKEPT